MPGETFCELAVVGAGPIGVEAATRARRRGLDVAVFERDRIGAHVRRWGHVDLFSPWRLNRSSWGEAILRENGYDLPDDEAFTTGAEYLERYLEPLADAGLPDGTIRCGTRVEGIARDGALKTEAIGDESRAERPFVLRIREGEEVRFVRSRYVVDATGVYETPNGLGPGGLRARGEREHADRIEYYIPDVLGDERDRYAGRDVLVVGGGYSAVTTLRSLQRLYAEARDTEITWLVRGDSEPYALIPDDPLPDRRELSEFGNAAADGEIPEIEPVDGTVVGVDAAGSDGVEVELRDGDSVERRAVDRLVANVGYRPNVEMLRELQVHNCYATEGAMDLAASLMASDSADCLDQDVGGIELLEHPEPGFYMIGTKSYGRNSKFLLQDGFEQVRQVVSSIAEGT